MARLFSFLLVLAAPAALACYNAMEEADMWGQKPGDALIAEANKHFANQNFQAALARAEAAYAEVKAADLSPVVSPQLRRAEQIAGQAALRLGKFKEAERYLAYADTQTARPFDRARLAEARVGLGKFSEAAPVLEELAKADLLPDGLSWKALAKARSNAGDLEGARTAEAQALSRGASNQPPIPADELPPGPRAPWWLWALTIAVVALGGAIAVKVRRGLATAAVG